MSNDESMQIYCVGCTGETMARLTDGSEIYPHRKDLYQLPFWKCDECGNYVGCHHKTKERTRPLGCIPTPEMKNARQYIHRLIDPLWKEKKIKRSRLYALMSEGLGRQYHTAELTTLDEAREAYRQALKIKRELK